MPVKIFYKNYKRLYIKKGIKQGNEGKMRRMGRKRGKWEELEERVDKFKREKD